MESGINNRRQVISLNLNIIQREARHEGFRPEQFPPEVTLQQQITTDYNNPT